MDRKVMMGVGALVLLVLTLVSAHTGDYNDYHYGMGGMMYGSYGYSGMIFGWLAGLLFVVILFLLIVWLIKEIQKK